MIGTRNLENRCAVTHDNECQGPHELNRQWIFILGHSKEIISQRFLLLDGKVLLLSAFSFDLYTAKVAMQKCGLWHSTEFREGRICSRLISAISLYYEETFLKDHSSLSWCQVRFASIEFY